MQNTGLLFLAILLSFTGCNGDEGQHPTEEINQNLYGTWQLVRKYNPETGWKPVSYNYTPYIKVQEEQIFETNLGACTTGEFVVKGNSIQFNYSCEHFVCGASGFLGEDSFSIKDDFLLLRSPDSEVGIGGIGEFKKIEEEDIVESPTEEHPTEEADQNLYGIWQLIEFTSGLESDNIENGYTIELLPNGNFFSTRFNECSQGTYSTLSHIVVGCKKEQNIISFHFPCEGFRPCSESTSFCNEQYWFTDGYLEYLILSPTYLVCDEGCVYKFRRQEQEYGYEEYGTPPCEG